MRVGGSARKDAQCERAIARRMNASDEAEAAYDIRAKGQTRLCAPRAAAHNNTLPPPGHVQVMPKPRPGHKVRRPKFPTHETSRTRDDRPLPRAARASRAIGDWAGSLSRPFPVDPCSAGESPAFLRLPLPWPPAAANSASRERRTPEYHQDRHSIPPPPAGQC